MTQIKHPLTLLEDKLESFQEQIIGKQVQEGLDIIANVPAENLFSSSLPTSS